MHTDLELGDGRMLHAYDTGADHTDGRLAVFWHHGTPSIGAPPEPLFPAAARLGIREGEIGVFREHQPCRQPGE